MIYLFTGNNRYLIQKECSKWKRAFSEKFSPENIIHISSLDIANKEILGEAFFARSLFSEKRMVIIDGFPFSSERQFSGATEIEAYILEALPKAGEELVIVFLSENPDKRKAGFKTLSKLAEVKQFSILNDEDVSAYLRNKYKTSIDANALSKVIYLKGGDLQKSISEIDKLLIHHNHISIQLVEENIIAEFEQSIFVFIDTLLSKNKKNIFKELDNLHQFSDIYALYQSILANIRIFLYIEFLKGRNKSSKEIGDILKLGNRQFLINKSHNSKFKDIKNLYENMLQFDKNMKFGKFISSDASDMYGELINIFIKY